MHSLLDSNLPVDWSDQITWARCFPVFFFCGVYKILLYCIVLYCIVFFILCYLEEISLIRQLVVAPVFKRYYSVILNFWREHNYLYLLFASKSISACYSTMLTNNILFSNWNVFWPCFWVPHKKNRNASGKFYNLSSSSLFFTTPMDRLGSSSESAIQRVREQCHVIVGVKIQGFVL